MAGRAFARGLLREGAGPAWDIYLFCEKDSEWTDSPPPAEWMHPLGGISRNGDGTVPPQTEPCGSAERRPSWARPRAVRSAQVGGGADPGSRPRRPATAILHQGSHQAPREERPIPWIRQEVAQIARVSAKGDQ
jgi:hypothetical protein